MYTSNHNEFRLFFLTKASLFYYNTDVCSLLSNLNTVLLHKRNELSSILLAHGIVMKESDENMQLLLEKNISGKFVAT